MYDKDKSGFIDMDELEQGIGLVLFLKKAEKGGEAPKAKDIMNRLDVSQDGKISRDEFVNGFLKHEDLKTLLYFATV